MNILKWGCAHRGVHGGAHCDTLQLPRWQVSMLLLFACMFYLEGGVARAKADIMREDDEHDWGAWETHKESKKSYKKRYFSHGFYK